MFNVYGWGPWAIQKQRNKIHPDLWEYMCLCQTIYGCLSRLRAAFDRLSVRRTLMTRRKYQDSVYLYIQLSVFSATQAIERTLFYFIFIILVFSVFHTNRTEPNQNSKSEQNKIENEANEELKQHTHNYICKVKYCESDRNYHRISFFFK